MRADAPSDNKVSIVQGSGSGHEPAHVMVVGKGMLDAACPGDVFAAPPMDYVLETTKLVASPKGVLLLVNNYTGDRMAFEMGQEMAEAEGILIETLFIDDDVAVKDSTYTVGRRGVAGNFFVIKAVGAAAEEGADLDELVRIGEKVNSRDPDHGHGADRVHAAGQGLAAVRARRRRDGDGRRHPRRAGPPPGEAGPANDIVDELLEAVVSDLPYQQGDDVALMINGLGGTPISELYILYGRAHQQLADRAASHVRPQLRRRVLHLAGHGRRVADAGQAGRRARRPAQRPGRDRHPDLLTAAAARSTTPATGAADCPARRDLAAASGPPLGRAAAALRAP